MFFKSLLIFTALVTSVVALADKLVPFKPAATTPVEPQRVMVESVPSQCEFKGLKLPKKFSIGGAGAYGGRVIGKQIDQSGHEATQIDITVSAPEPIVLILGAYEPTIWNIGWTKKTKILAVIASGYHRQVIAGLEKKVPVLITTFENRNPCGYFYFAEEEIPKINELSTKLFGRSMDIASNAIKGSATIGVTLEKDDEIVTSNWKKVDSYFDSKAPLAGPAGVHEAVTKGILRSSTQEDIDAVIDRLEELKGVKKNAKTLMVGFEKPGNKRNLPGSGGQPYTVVKEFTYPSGLYGAHSFTFIIQKGVPTPKGEAGHSTVYDLNDPAVCKSFGCK